MTYPLLSLTVHKFLSVPFCTKTFFEEIFIFSQVKFGDSLMAKEGFQIVAEMVALGYEFIGSEVVCC